MCSDQFGRCNPERDGVFSSCPTGFASANSTELSSYKIRLPEWYFRGDWGLLREKENEDGEGVGAHLLEYWKQGSDQDQEAMMIIKAFFPGLWRGMVIELGALDGKQFR
jgi:hypothetical protein